MRRAGSPTTSPATKQTASATGMVYSARHPASVMRMPVVYAPSPKKAEWPTETIPVYPVAMLRPAMAMA
jgi:hypothetical protein